MIKNQRYETSRSDQIVRFWPVRFSVMYYSDVPSSVKVNEIIDMSSEEHVF